MFSAKPACLQQQNFAGEGIQLSKMPLPTSRAANAMDAAIAEAAALSLEGKHVEAAQVIVAALGQAGPGSAGWQALVDPLIHATAHRGAWAPVFAMLRDRAT